MRVSVSKPELTRFIEEQVSAGRYPSAEAVVEAAVAELRDLSNEGLDDETIDAINRAEEQIDRGEGIDFRVFAAEMRRKIGK